MNVIIKVNTQSLEACLFMPLMKFEFPEQIQYIFQFHMLPLQISIYYQIHSDLVKSQITCDVKLLIKNNLC